MMWVMEHELPNWIKTKRTIQLKRIHRNVRTRAVFVGTVDDGSGGDLIEFVIVCEWERFDDDLVLADVLLVLSRLASVSAFIFCFIASVGSTYHLENNFKWILFKWWHEIYVYFDENILFRNRKDGGREQYIERKREI